MAAEIMEAGCSTYSRSLSAGQPIPSPSPVLRLSELSPFADAEGLIHIGGRLYRLKATLTLSTRSCCLLGICLRPSSFWQPTTTLFMMELRPSLPRLKSNSGLGKDDRWSKGRWSTMLDMRTPKANHTCRTTCLVAKQQNHGSNPPLWDGVGFLWTPLRAQESPSSKSLHSIVCKHCHSNNTFGTYFGHASVISTLLAFHQFVSRRGIPTLPTPTTHGTFSVALGHPERLHQLYKSTPLGSMCS